LSVVGNAAWLNSADVGATTWPTSGWQLKQVANARISLERRIRVLRPNPK
jgi:hypothetical protein